MKLMSQIAGRRALVLFIFSGFIVMAFQNCGKAGFDSLNSEAPTTANSLSSLSSSSPFAFKSSFDTIAYNSCFGSGLSSKSPYFTIRAGAYENSGTHLTQDFMSYARAKIKPSYPNTTITADQVTSFLASSALNADAQLQYSIRSSNNLTQVGGIYRQNSAPTIGIDFFNLLGPLTDVRWSLDLVNKGLMSLNDEPDDINYFKLGPRGYRSLEVSHSWNTDESLAQSIRKAFQSDAMITLTYADSSAGSARAPSSTDVTKAYGVGYKLNFGVEVPGFQHQCSPIYDSKSQSYTGCQTPGTGTSDASSYLTPDNLNPDNILSSLQEIDLTTGTQVAGSAWTCDATMRFIVVRPTDQAALCPKGEDSINLANGSFGNQNFYYRDLERVRRVLPADQWDVNLTRRCVVPKEGDCYSQEKINNALVPVQYDISKTCYQNLDIPYGGTAPVNICAQFVTICTK